MNCGETIRCAELAMAGVEYLKRQYNCSQSLSLDKEASKKVMIYYAAPKPETYGYFSSTSESARESWFNGIIDTYTKQTKNLIWC